MYCHRTNNAAYPTWSLAHAGAHLVERYLKSAAKTLVVLSHYPVDNLYAHPEFLDLLSDNSKHDVGTDTIRIRVGRR